MTRGPLQRVLAVVLSWAVPAAPCWSLAPPRGAAGAVASGPDGTGFPHDDDGAAVWPILECVAVNADGSFTAHFGYRNEGDRAVTILAGPHNGFAPGRADRGQPRVFQRGRSPRFPEAAFRVIFDGESLAWSLRGPDGRRRTATASRRSARCGPGPAPTPSPTPEPMPSPTPGPDPTPDPGPAPPAACAAPVFGPERFVRTRGRETVAERTFAIPAGVSPPFLLLAENGSGGGHRASAAWIWVNGELVLGPKLFCGSHRSEQEDDPDDGGDHERRHEGHRPRGPRGPLVREVRLTPVSTLRVRLRSKPGSHVTVRICGERGDVVPPSLAWVEPARLSNDPTPRLAVRYSDEGPGASGVDASTLGVQLDGVDRSGLFTRRPDEASLELPTELALSDGVHTIEAGIADLAGNRATARSEFSIDTRAPVVAVDEPAPGGFVATPAPSLSVSYRDDCAPTPAGCAAASGIGPSSIRIWLDGADATQAFALGPAWASGIPASPLPDGEHVLRVTLLDRAGNPAAAEGRFVVDTRAPVVSFSSSDGAYVGDLEPDGTYLLTGTVSDVDPSVRIECATGSSVHPAAIDGVSWTCAVPLIEGANRLALRASDRSGHSSEAVRTLHLDTRPPEVAIDEPLPGSFVPSTTVTVRVRATDASPLSVEVNGQPANCEGEAAGCGPGSYSAVVTLASGGETLTATATDAAGHTASASVSVGVDSAAPSVAIDSPAAGSFLRGGMIAIAGTAEDETPVVVEVNGVPALVEPVAASGPRPGHRFRAEIPAADGALEVTAVAFDAAGNSGRASVAVNVDSAPPAIRVESPPDGFATRDTTVTVLGTLSDASASTLDVGGQPVACDASGAAPLSCAFAAVVPLAGEGPLSLELRARDAAGNEAVRPVALVVDRTAPLLSILSPAPGAVLGALPVVVQGLASDQTPLEVEVAGIPATVVGGAWQAAIPALGEGAHTLDVSARDAAGNRSSAALDVVVDLGPPLLTVTSPEPASLTRLAEVVVAGTVSDRSDVEVEVTGVQAQFRGDGSGLPLPFSLGPVPLSEGDNALTVRAVDRLGRSAHAPLLVTRDSTPPSVEVGTPESISRGRAGQAVVSASDAGGLDRVSVTLRCLAAAGPSCAETRLTLTAFPATVPLSVPEGASSGHTLVVEAEAIDRAGNSRTAARSVRIASDGVLAGQVLDDTTGLPLASAAIAALVEEGSTRDAGVSDERGAYSIPVAGAWAAFRVAKEGFTTVDREVAAASGQGTVPVDARLTRLARAVEIDERGGTVLDEPASGTGSATRGALVLAIDVPPAAPGTYRLTRLSPQGLPNLLPLGYSPLAAFDWRAECAAVCGGGTARVSGLPEVPVHLARYDPASRAWRMVAPSLAVADGALSFAVPEPGSFALVSQDLVEPPMAVAPAGHVMEGIAMVEVPATAASAGQVTPAILPPAGGTAAGWIALRAPVPLPSGTVVQADATETYELATGEQASTEPRRMDIVAFRQLPAGLAPVGDCPAGALCASFPITPSRNYAPADLVSGRVHLDILAGREGVRGQVGGSEAVTLDAGAVRLSVPAGALSEDVALVLEQHPLSPFLPTSAGLIALAEAVADFGGRTLATPAELSVSSPGVDAADTLVFASVERVEGVPRLAVVALGQLVGERVVSRPYPGLPGLVKGGRIVLYRLAAPIGFVAGVTSAGGSPVKALVEPAPGDPGSLPFVSLSRLDGGYILASAPGPRTLQAWVPGTSLVASATVPVVAGETAALSLALAGAVTAAAVSPADGERGVPTSATIEIASLAPLDPATVVPGNFSLERLPEAGGAPQAVPFRLVLSGTGKLLSVIPQAVPGAAAPAPGQPPASALEHSREYRFSASGLVDAVGGLVTVPTVTFRTKDFVAPFYDPRKLVFGMPDADGIAKVTAPGCWPEPGCFYPGTTILIINSGNGFVLSLTVGNSGEVDSELPATIDDTLFVTIEDPLGNSVSFKKGQYYNAETKETAVGPAGGVIEASDGSGVELRIPEGALDVGKTFKISLLPESAYADTFPNQVLDKLLPGTHVGGVLKIEASPDTVLKKYAKLAFPMPDFTKAPENERPADPKKAFYYMSRAHRACPGGGQACPDEQKITIFETIDEAQVEGEGANAKVATASPPFPSLAGAIGGVAMMIVSWEIGRLLANVLVRRPGMISGTVQRQRWNPGAVSPTYEPVSGAEVTGRDLTGEVLTNKDGGTFASTQSDGRFVLWDMNYSGGLLNMIAKSGIQEIEATAYEATDTFLQRYQKRATVNLTFPAVSPPPPPPGLDIRFFDAASSQELSGVAVVGKEIKVSLRLANEEATLQSGSINGEARGVALDPLGGGDPRLWILSGGEFRPEAVGVYTVQATALPKTGPPFTVTQSIRVIAAGGSVDNLPNDTPRVTFASPTPEVGGVEVGVLPEILFSEPVKRLRNGATGEDNVRLHEVNGGSLGARVPVLLSGISPSGSIVTDQELANPATAVTSLTLRPAFGLKYGQTYRLILTDGIEDLDKNAQGSPAPKKLVPFDSEFLTFGPVGVGAAVDVDRTPLGTGSASIVVMNDRASGGVLDNRRALITRTNNFVNGNLLSVDIADPVQPRLVGTSATFAPRPYDLAADPNGPYVAVAVGPTTLDKPSSVLLFDVTSDVPEWVGAASVASSAFEGFIARIAMLGNYVYTATAKKGVQVVNVQKARDELEAARGRVLGEQNARRDLNTSGAGFGQEAVELTTPIPSKPNGTAYQLTDIRVMEIGGHPLAVVTGEPGLIVTSPQTGALLYPPNTTPFVGNVEHVVDVSGTRTLMAKLSWGLTLALGRLQDNYVAVVVGNGEVGGIPGRRVLMVVDLENPNEPTGIGSVDITSEIETDMIPVDVQLREQTALVGIQTATGERGYVLLVNLADLQNPQTAGRIQDTERPVGGRLAFDQHGLLYSTARMSTGGQSVLGGVKTATFNVLAAVTSARPTLVRTVDLPGQPLQETTLSDIPFSFAVFPSTYEATAPFFEVRTTGGQGVSQPVVLTSGRGAYTLPKGLVKNTSEELLAVFSFDVSGRHVVSVPRPVEIVHATLTVDSNNDTIVNDADDVAVRTDPNKNDPQKALAFGFWDADSNPPANAGLVDYATLRLTLDQGIAQDERIGLRLSGSDWTLEKKLRTDELGALVGVPNGCAAEGKLHLCHSEAELRQRQRNAEGGAEAPVPLGNGVVEIPRVLLRKGANEFLFKCNARADGAPGCPASKLELVRIDDADRQLVDERRVDIKPLTQWITVYNARSDPSDARPDGAFSPRPTAELQSGWQQVPTGTSQVTALIHGFNVTETGALTRFIPSYFKRLYWSGHPVHARQSDESGGTAHTVGFVWPGDQSAVDPAFTGLFFPEDEFHALQSGVTLSRLLVDVIKPASRKINVVAHSLGNMVVNSALMHDGMAGVIDRYVMNDAAIPAEAFDSNYEYSALEQDTLFPHARRHGFATPADEIANDSLWAAEWAEIEAGRPFTRDANGFEQPNYDDRDAWLSRREDTHLFPKPLYETRWSQARPNELPPTEPVPVARRGPWRGLFDASASKTSILNTYNPADQVLLVSREASIDLNPNLASAAALMLPLGFKSFSVFAPTGRLNAWFACQRIQKPRMTNPTGGLDTALFGRFDSRVRRFWADLGLDGGTRPYEYLWGPGQNHSNITRQWAELAFWFPALSVAAGTGELNRAGIRNESFADYGKPEPSVRPGEILLGVTTHTYMTDRSIPKVWSAFKRVRSFISDGQ